MTELELLVMLQSRNIVMPNLFYSLDVAQRHQAFTVSKLSSVEEMKTVMNALSKSIEKGGTFNDFKKQVAKDGIVLPQAYLDNVFRTNIQNAYARGRWQEQQANKDDRPYLQYRSVNDNRTRATHRALDKITRPIDDDWWSNHFPPLSFRCRCYSVSLTERDAIEQGVTPEARLPKVEPYEGYDYNATQDPGRQLDEYAQQKLDETAKQFPTIKPNIEQIKADIQASSEFAKQLITRLEPTVESAKTLPTVAASLAKLDPTIKPSAAAMVNAYAQGEGKHLSDLVNDTLMGVAARSWLRRAFDSILGAAKSLKKRITGNFDIPFFQFESGQVIGINNPSLFKDAIAGQKIEIINAIGLGIELSKIGSDGVLLPPDVRLEVVGVNNGIVTLQPTDKVANQLFNASNGKLIMM